MANQRQTVEELFEAALAVEPAQRSAFLNVCQVDSAGRQQLEDLLADDARAGDFLERPPCDLWAKASSEYFHREHPDSPGRLAPGEVLIDRFNIVRRIATGGMAEVYEVEDRYLQGVHVALKAILPHIAESAALRQRFQKEVLVAREVSHPNLCPIYDIFRSEQPPAFLFFTMKLLPGGTLYARLAELAAEEKPAIVRQIVAGLKALHDAGVVHRDIKPKNIMVDGKGANVRVWITDFGLARASETETSFEHKGAVAGTPGYIAPELFRHCEPSQATDLFAFGVVLHEIFTGEKPVFAEESSRAVLTDQLNASETPAFFIRLIKGCLDADPRCRCHAFEDALAALVPGYKTAGLWTRRRFAFAAASLVCGLSVGAWAERDSVYDLLHPLPPKRFVALLKWPKTTDSQVSPMLTGALSAIKSELARLESVDRNLFVISPDDLNQDVSPSDRLKDICDPLGANLAMTASGRMRGQYLELVLRLLDPVSGQTLRERLVRCAFSELTALAAKAVPAAASLLDLPQSTGSDARLSPDTQSVEAFRAFQSAEMFRKQPDDSGLNAAIEKYKEALDLDPRYATANAELAQAYVRLYELQRNPGALDLARANCDRALELQSNLVEGHLARAAVLECTGDHKSALDEISRSLTLDPQNPKAMLWQAEVLEGLNRWSDAENAYLRVMKERPNSWVIYDEFGTFLQKQGRFPEAVKAFRSAGMAAPGSAIALSDLGSAYLQTGQFDSAIEVLRKSLALAPNGDYVLANTSLALRYQGKYQEALPYAQRAVLINPNNDANWLELADCYASLKSHDREARSAYLRAVREAEAHLQSVQGDGPSWMLLALYQVKAGVPQDGLSSIRKAEAFGAGDMDSQLYKVRTLEQLGRRDDALATLAVCFRRGATPLQLKPFPDMQDFRQDPRYRRLVNSVGPASSG